MRQQDLALKLPRLTNYHDLPQLNDGKLARMMTDNVESGGYSRDYQHLELDKTANWSAAQINYRRLVHLVHPDRFTQRPRERAHAQNQFIQLNKSFNRIRTFYRKNHRMPLEPRRPAGTSASATTSTGAVFDPDLLDENMVLEAGMLARSADEELHDIAPPSRRGLWIIPAVLLVIGMAGAFYVLDYNARKKVFNEGREVLRNSEPSDFLPSSREVQRGMARGTFIERGNGKLGDQLMNDVFR